MQDLLTKLQVAREAMGVAAARVARPAATREAAAADFGALLKTSLDQVNASQVAADRLTARFQANDPNVSLEDTMVGLAKANVSLQAAVQVRNRVVAAYHDIMNMQV